MVIVVYDVTDVESFQSCAKWHERVKAQKSSPDMKLPGIDNDILCIIMGNQ